MLLKFDNAQQFLRLLSMLCQIISIMKMFGVLETFLAENLFFLFCKLPIIIVDIGKNPNMFFCGGLEQGSHNGLIDFTTISIEVQSM